MSEQQQDRQGRCPHEPNLRPLPDRHVRPPFRRIRDPLRPSGPRVRRERAASNRRRRPGRDGASARGPGRERVGMARPVLADWRDPPPPPATARRRGARAGSGSACAACPSRLARPPPPATADSPRSRPEPCPAASAGRNEPRRDGWVFVVRRRERGGGFSRSAGMPGLRCRSGGQRTIADAAAAEYRRSARPAVGIAPSWGTSPRLPASRGTVPERGAATGRAATSISRGTARRLGMRRGVVVDRRQPRALDPLRPRGRFEDYRDDRLRLAA